MSSILFLIHETSRSGAPLVILYFIQWLKKTYPDIEVTVLDLREGPIGKKFEIISDHYISLLRLEESNPTFVREISQKFLKKFGWKNYKTSVIDSIIENLADSKFEIIYANTIITIPIARRIKASSSYSKIVVHVHELEIVIETALPNFKEFIPEITSFIAVSNLVKRNLHENYGISPKNIRTFYEFTLPPKLSKNIEKGTFTVGGAGNVDWRKGYDFFIQVAYIVKSKLPESKIDWVWVGKIDTNQRKIIAGDIQKSGLLDKVYFVGELEDPHHHFSEFNIFLLPSREDPFPLVAIEAAMMKIPIICFEGASGTAEILIKGGGEVVPYMDVNEMAHAVIKFFKNPKKVIADGEDAQRLFSAFTPEEICPEIFNFLNTIKSFK